MWSNKRSRHRQLFNIRHAINPDRFGTQQFTYTNGEHTRSRTCSDHHIRTHSYHNDDNLNQHAKQTKFIPSARIFYNIAGVAGNCRLVSLNGRNVAYCVVFKCRAQTQQLHPMSATGRYGQDFLFLYQLIDQPSFFYCNNRLGQQQQPLGYSVGIGKQCIKHFFVQ